MNLASNSPSLAELDAVLAPTAIAAEPPPDALPSFSLDANAFLRQFQDTKRKDKASRAGIKKLIRPDNAEAFWPHIPRHGETTHAIVRGDFVFCDLIPVLLRDQAPATVYISTLGMSAANARALDDLRNKGRITTLKILVSHYFSRVDANSVYAEVSTILGDCIHVARTHAKVITIDAEPNQYTLAGSANLRSSDNVEQFAVWNDKEVLNFHTAWMDELMSRTAR